MIHFTFMEGICFVNQTIFTEKIGSNGHESAKRFRDGATHGVDIVKRALWLIS